jgi:hypothetical protein
VGVHAADYSCVRSGVGFSQMASQPYEAEIIKFSGTGDVPLSFPKSVDDIPLLPTDWDGWNLQFDDCSDEAVVCKRVTLIGRQDWRAWEYLMALPRVLQSGKSYDVRGVQVVTARMPETAPNSPLRIQVRFLASDGEPAVPFVLTLEQGKGVVFLDGMRFTREEKGAGELCVLRTPTGILADVVLKGD